MLLEGFSGDFTDSLSENLLLRLIKTKLKTTKLTIKVKNTYNTLLSYSFRETKAGSGVFKTRFIFSFFIFLSQLGQKIR